MTYQNNSNKKSSKLDTKHLPFTIQTLLDLNNTNDKLTDKQDILSSENHEKTIQKHACVNDSLKHSTPVVPNTPNSDVRQCHDIADHLNYWPSTRLNNKLFLQLFKNVYLSQIQNNNFQTQPTDMHQSNFLQKCFIQSQDIHDLSKVIASSSYMKQPSINCHTVNSIPSVQDIANHLHRSQFTNLLDFTSSSSSYPAGYSSKLPLFTSKSQKPYSFLKSFNPNIFEMNSLQIR
ncbi:unnamed protein product [Heterobilharzia americana]|nr:unnamed protein product [Heterobilharzia americana]